MELTVHGKQIDVGNALRTHVEDKLEDINQKYFDHAAYATVTFSREGHGHQKTKTNIQIQVGKNLMVISDATEQDPYVSFEAAAEKAAKQLRRYKRKIRDHHARMEHTPENEIIKARDYVLAAAPEQNDEPQHEEAVDGDVEQGDEPLIIAELPKDILTLSVSDAVMHMELSGGDPVLFRNKANNEMNMVYKRTDGNVGWVDPQNQQKK